MDACEQEMDFKKKKNQLYVVFIPNDVLSQTTNCSRLFKKIKIKKSPVILQFLRISASNYYSCWTMNIWAKIKKLGMACSSLDRQTRDRVTSLQVWCKFPGKNIKPILSCGATVAVAFLPQGQDSLHSLTLLTVPCYIKGFLAIRWGHVSQNQQDNHPTHTNKFTKEQLQK